MHTKVVPNHQRLKLRIEDYFDSSEGRKHARVFLDTLAGHAHTWIFGGMIRDISLFGRKGFTSDIDIVIDSPQAKLLAVLATLEIYSVSTNKLGGMRFHHSGLDFDVWSLKDTWAFKHKLIEFEEPRSLLKTTLMSWDSVLYDINHQRVISSENYFQDLHNKRLELVLQATPNPVGSVIKILRTIHTKNVEIIGPHLCAFLTQALKDDDYTRYIKHELAHYSGRSFTAYHITRLRERLNEARPGADVRIA